MAENTHKGEGGGITDPAYPARFMHTMEGALANQSVYTVHNRLMSEAVRNLIDNAMLRTKDHLGRLEGDFEDVLRQVAQEAYTRGVRDGYVQAVSEGPEA